MCHCTNIPIKFAQVVEEIFAKSYRLCCSFPIQLNCLRKESFVTRWRLLPGAETNTDEGSILWLGLGNTGIESDNHLWGLIILDNW